MSISVTSGTAVFKAQTFTTFPTIVGAREVPGPGGLTFWEPRTEGESFFLSVRPADLDRLQPDITVTKDGEVFAGRIVEGPFAGVALDDTMMVRGLIQKRHF